MKPVTVYAEMTPNPNTMKFVTDYMLVPSGNVVEFLSASYFSSSFRLYEVYLPLLDPTGQPRSVKRSNRYQRLIFPEAV